MHKSPKQRGKLHRRSRRISCLCRDHVPPNRDWGGSLPAATGWAPAAAAPRTSTGGELLSWASSGGQACRRKHHGCHTRTRREKPPETLSVASHHSCFSPHVTASCREQGEVKLVTAQFLDMLGVTCASCNSVFKKRKKKRKYQKV